MFYACKFIFPRSNSPCDVMTSCLTRWQNVVPLQDACRRQVVDDVLEADMFEH